MSYDPRGFGERLAQEMATRGVTVPQLSEAVRNRSGGARGTSYGSVWAYAQGKGPETAPRREVVEALAEELQVLPDWLLEGDGPRTTEEEVRVIRHTEEGDQPQARRVRLHLQAMKRARQKLPWMTPGLEYVVDALVIQFFHSSGRRLEDYSPEQVEEATMLLGWLMFLPGQALGSTDWIQRRGGAEEIVLAMATALRLAMPRKGEGTPLNALNHLRNARRRWEGGGGSDRDLDLFGTPGP